ncbi:cytochrome c [Pelagibacteraceae bacterium]|nr:cytochrome c [Pelagibacteraceae bacterium]
MHNLISYIRNNIKINLLLFFIIGAIPAAYAEQSAENIIKERQALFSKNYNTAKRVQSLSSKGKLDEAKRLMMEMSKNYKKLLTLFPENTKEGFRTEALPSVWEDKKSFDALMQQSSDRMVELTKTIDKSSDIEVALKQNMWGSCKSCHSKYRKEH